jgi:hypothetical protein
MTTTTTTTTVDNILQLHPSLLGLTAVNALMNFVIKILK